MNQNHFNEDDVALDEDEIALGVVYYRCSDRRVVFAVSGNNPDKVITQHFIAVEPFSLANAQSIGSAVFLVAQALPENALARRVYEAAYRHAEGDALAKSSAGYAAAAAVLDFETPDRNKRGS